MSRGSEGVTPETPSAVLSEAASATEERSNPWSSRRNLLIAGGLATAWILTLLFLAWTTANPVTLNRKQIERSHFVVTATRESKDSSMLIVSKEWKHGRELGTISVINLKETGMPVGREFLVPLEAVSLRDDDTPQYAVTKTTLPNEAPLIYPATPEAKSALEEQLKN